LFERVEGFPRTAIDCRRAAARHGVQFIQDGSSILVHSFSKVVMELLYVAAAIQHKRFKVFATEARPSHNAEKVRSFLQDLNIPCHIILDTAVGYFMQKMDFVLFGAEGVVENGGIINQVSDLFIVWPFASGPIHCPLRSPSLLYLLYCFIDWHVSNKYFSQSGKQASVCPGRNVQVCPALSLTPI